MKWVGRAIRRVEDPALITGQGRFTADLPAAHWVRFVRSPLAAGKIEKIVVPDGARVITAADLDGVKKITPMLHKFNYKPVAQPVLADGVRCALSANRSPPWWPRARKTQRTSRIRSSCCSRR